MSYFNGKMSIYSAHKAKIALLSAKKDIILAQYLDFVDIFFKKWTAKFFKYFAVNKQLIYLELNK